MQGQPQPTLPTSSGGLFQSISALKTDDDDTAYEQAQREYEAMLQALVNFHNLQKAKFEQLQQKPAEIVVSKNADYANMQSDWEMFYNQRKIQ